jgi:hypothetical protein
MVKTHILQKHMRYIRKEGILYAAIIILVILLALTTLYAVRTSSVNKSVLSNLASYSAKTKEERIQASVNEIEERRYRYPVIDIKENRVYIPEVHMYVPLTENSRDLRYEVWSDTVWLSASIAVGRQTGNQDASCDKVVLLTESEKKGQGYIAVGTIKASDGRVRYIFRHPACDIYSDSFSKDLADVAKQIQYY